MMAFTRAIGQSGRWYAVERILQDKPGPLGRIYLATNNGQRYVLKSVARNEFSFFQKMFKNLRHCPYVRIADDAIPDQSMFAYKYLKENFLSFVQNDVPLPLMKRVLKDSLRGIDALHQEGIVHTDIKANNILVQWEETETKEGGKEMTVSQVQVADLEDAIYVPKHLSIQGKQFGNWMWRSPEAHASAQVYQPTDMFSFGIVCIYAITKRVIFAVGDEELEEGEEKMAIVIERQLSYFSNSESYVGLLEYLGDSPWCELFKVVSQGFSKELPREPFEMWEGLDKDFQDLVGKMTSVNPRRRITAEEALKHRWFEDVP